MKTLHEIGTETGTDKARHVHDGQSYLNVYAYYLEPKRFLAKNILELGVLDGASLRMWSEYFTQAQVYGVDINPTAITASLADRVSVIVGSQADPLALSLVAPGQLLDVVIDDASHLVHLILASFHLLWPRVKPGGIYAIEDLSCTYLDLWPYRKEWPGQDLNGSESFTGQRTDFDQFVSGLIRSMDHGHSENIRSIHFWPSQCILTKA